MDRIACVVAPGFPHHVTQRGNCRQQTFLRDDDYAAYLDLMAAWCRKRSPLWTSLLLLELTGHYDSSTIKRWGTTET